MIIYEAYFLENSFSGSLEKQIKNQHITICFKPENPAFDKYGSEAYFEIVGIANDRENEALKVAPLYNLEELDGVAVPHVTLSVSATGKPVNSSKLDFIKLSGYPVIKAKFGGFTDKGKVIFSKEEEDE